MTTLAFVDTSPFGHMFGIKRLIICISCKRCSLSFDFISEPGVASFGEGAGFAFAIALGEASFCLTCAGDRAC